MKRFTVLVVILVLGIISIIALAQSGLPEDVAGYLTWQRANAQKSYEESAHPVAKDIYYNATADITIATGSFPHSEGSVFVKERMDPETLTVTTLYTMRKVPGFNADGGDWQYGLFERGEDGVLAGDWMSVEGAAMCVGCHVGAQATDYTFLNYLGQ
jgi:hypothetical protein